MSKSVLAALAVATVRLRQACSIGGTQLVPGGAGHAIRRIRCSRSGLCRVQRHRRASNGCTNVRPNASANCGADGRATNGRANCCADSGTHSRGDDRRVADDPAFERSRGRAVRHRLAHIGGGMRVRGR